MECYTFLQVLPILDSLVTSLSLHTLHCVTLMLVAATPLGSLSLRVSRCVVPGSRTLTSFSIRFVSIFLSHAALASCASFFTKCEVGRLAGACAHDAHHSQRRGGSGITPAQRSPAVGLRRGEPRDMLLLLGATSS